MAYTVKNGDTLNSIANKYGTTWEDIYNANKYTIDSMAKANGATDNFQDYIYKGQQLYIPGAINTENKTTQNYADEYAMQQTANAKDDTNALLAQYEKIAEQQKNALENQRLQTQNQINSQRQGVLDAYNNNARQAYINSMLGKQDVKQQLSQAGLNTSGLVGSAYANVQNTYGNNLVNLQNNRDNSLRNIDTQLNNANLEYNIQENQLLGEIEKAKLELQKYGNELAYNRYQDALANYMNFANYDYNRERDNANLEYQRAQDNYNREYQERRDAVSDEQWQKNYDLALRQLEESLKKSSSSGSSGSSRSSSGYNWNIADSYVTNEPVEEKTLSDAGNNLYNQMSFAIDKYPSASGKSVSEVKNLVTKVITQRYQDGEITDDDVRILVDRLGLE